MLPAACGGAGFSVDAVLDAIRIVESAGKPWSIFDNTTRQSLDPVDRSDAEDTARLRLQLGHNLDLGAYQINSIQLRRRGLALEAVFDPAVQRTLAETIFGEFLARARLRYGDSALAWERAIGAYNAGRVDADNPAYVARVLALLGRSPFAPPAANGIDRSEFANGLGEASTDAVESLRAALGALAVAVAAALLAIHGGFLAVVRWVLLSGIVSIRSTRRAAFPTQPR